MTKSSRSSKSDVSRQSQNYGPTGQPGKNRPTPKRRDAQAARKAAMKRPLSRRERAAREREARAALRRNQFGKSKVDELRMRRGDMGPARRYARDYVDSRRRLAEFMLPLLLLILTLSLVRLPWAVPVANALWAATIVTVGFEALMLFRSLRKNITQLYGAEHTKRIRIYALMRMTQPRFLRNPRPGIKIGEAPRH